jgi:predicted RNase H-like nuclease (RuvC/YqgF family)
MFDPVATLAVLADAPAVLPPAAIGAGVTGLVTWLRNRREQKRADRRESPELADLISRACQQAVESVKVALEEAEQRLTETRGEVAALRLELAEARAELHTAIETREHLAAELAQRDATIALLRSELDRALRRIGELEAKVGGRRRGD